MASDPVFTLVYTVCVNRGVNRQKAMDATSQIFDYLFCIRGVNRQKAMDATISVICFKSKTLANGEHPLMLRITKDRKRTMKSLGVSVHPSNWDFDRNEPKPKCPDRKYIQQIILKVKSEYQTRLLEKAARDEDYTAETLVKE